MKKEQWSCYYAIFFLYGQNVLLNLDYQLNIYHNAMHQTGLIEDASNGQCNGVKQSMISISHTEY